MAEAEANGNKLLKATIAADLDIVNLFDPEHIYGISDLKRAVATAQSKVDFLEKSLKSRRLP
jgi:hypothetical protein